MNMRGLDISLLFAGILLYFGYLIIPIFSLRSAYEYGMYLFTPLFLYTLFRVLNARIKKMSLLLTLYLATPFFLSVYLSLIGAMPVWEVTGILPLPVLLSFSFRSDKSSSPLFTTMLLPAYGVFFALVAFFTCVNYLSRGDGVKSFQLLLSIYSPAIVTTTVLVFARFIIEAAGINIVLNNFRLFIHGTGLRRILFDSPRFLSLEEVHLSGIITAEGVSHDSFIARVNELNKEFTASEENTDILRRDAKFTRTLPNGTTLTLGTLYLLIEKEGFNTDGLPLPPDLTAKSYVALAENERIIGYYVIDRFNASANHTMIKVLRDTYGIQAVIIGKENAIHLSGIDTVATLDDAAPRHDDLLVTDEPASKVPCITALWGKAPIETGDLFLAEPSLFTIMKLIIVLSTIRSRIQRSIALTSTPFLLPLFLSIYGIHLPQLNAIAVLLMMLLTITQILRSMRTN